jgi:hypothetical protein
MNLNVVAAAAIALALIYLAPVRTDLSRSARHALGQPLRRP